MKNKDIEEKLEKEILYWLGAIKVESELHTGLETERINQVCKQLMYLFAAHLQEYKKEVKEYLLERCHNGKDADEKFMYMTVTNDLLENILK